MTNTRDIILTTFLAVLEEGGGDAKPVVTDDMILLESGLDSLGFAILVAKLEEEQGWDPFSLSQTPYYPQKFGEFVAFYDTHCR
jgi:acyl carrier protein